jgi:hypothetical protein
MDRNMADQTELTALAKKAKANLPSMKTTLDELLGTDTSGKAT